MSHSENPLLPMRMAVNIGLDGALAALAVGASFWLANPAAPMPHPNSLPLAGAAAIWLLGIPFGLSRLHWRYVSLRDLVLVGSAAIITTIMLTLLMVGAGFSLPSPAFPFILVLTLTASLTVPKLLYRMVRQKRGVQGAAQTALLVGDGENAELFLSAHAQQKGIVPYRVTGLIALSEKHIGRRLQGLDVVGASDEAEAMLARLAQKPDLLIVTAPHFTGDRLQALMRTADALNIRVMRAPCLTKLAPADQQVALLPIAIEDLLNRRQVRLDHAAMAKMIAGRRVMVTGAGGSIGAELCRQIAGFGPAEILLLDSSEFALWQIDLEIKELAPALPRQTIVADVRNAPHIRAIAQAFRPELVFHAAALKHVPIVEANKLEGLRTNALGTQLVADAAAASGAKLMVLISTDKAVNPSSVMGASKRLAEMYAQALDVEARHKRQGMRCVTVRFGNVLGSTGSVVPLFRRQLAQGGPLTVTDPAMQRYFMTVREAVGLVLQASAVGCGEEAIPDGGIFVLDMGEPVKIVDLARQMIRLAGLKPDEDIKIKFTGLRPGEKLFEELFHGAEQPVPTGYEGLLMATPRFVDLAAVNATMQELAQSARHGDEAYAMALLHRMVPEFLPPPGLAVPRAAE
ncbi:polysaccharide biosynthesis protein [Acidocella aminolytica]|uniref:Polysaccharide biosynthesis nucleotide sugar epimerase dehydratase n=1 Tax=Acidocella aminolytica 101 = DSM 11237 TaxID=1120923 RepID=A0A0D6PED7_9PROT|nr:nucleoside-diphosphate sugar epimerase/dehydratase [Acidocella aminolytica]GAN79701.1 polysaccharide biosynthesis nucleotide sugar epimerase dehydratase [Acidocella aminolytica 101 = DSM 11237]SHE74006.1 O-antigen biosynthesis protein WbqV [Acidocella aminolytica 101 = DSM 11237]